MEQSEQTLYVPLSESTEVSVWSVDPNLQMFTNMLEERAAILADDNPTFIYFFAELTTED